MPKSAVIWTMCFLSVMSFPSFSSAPLDTKRWQQKCSIKKKQDFVLISVPLFWICSVFLSFRAVMSTFLLKNKSFFPSGWKHLQQQEFLQGIFFNPLKFLRLVRLLPAEQQTPPVWINCEPGLFCIFFERIALSVFTFIQADISFNQRFMFILLKKSQQDKEMLIFAFTSNGWNIFT